MSNSEIKEFKVKKLPKNLQPSSLYYVKVEPDKFKIYLTDSKCPPTPYSLDGSGSAKIITSPDGSIQVVETETNTEIQIDSSILAQINASLQTGDNVSELVNDAGYLTISDVPPFDPSDYDLEEFNNNGADPYAHQSDIIIYTNEEAQDAVGTILLDTATIDLSYNDGTPGISADVKLNSIDATHLSNSINVSEFVNDSGYSTTTYADSKVIDSIADADTTHAPSRNAVFDALALKGDMTTSTAQTVSGVKTFLAGMLGLRSVANTFTSLFTNVNTASRTYTLQDRTGTLAMLDDFIPQITITTAVSITTTTNDASGVGQKGRNVVIDNGATAINITVNGGVGFVASYVKHGAGAITFVQGSGRTLIQVDSTVILNGAVGSTATISSIGTTDYLRISNA